MSYQDYGQANGGQAWIDRLRTEWLNNVHMMLEKKRSAVVVYEGYATGLSHHDYEAMWKFIKEGTTLTVKPDPDNKYDPQATGLWMGGRQIGWIPKALNGPISHAWKNGLTFNCAVMAHRPEADYGYKLQIKIIALTHEYVDEQRDIYTRTVEDYARTTSFTIQKDEPIMATKSVNQIVEQNISLGTSAAFLEAGRIANVQLSSIASKKLPIMVRAYADTALGRLLLANVALMAKDHFRPNDERLGKLVNAMTVSAYQEVLQQFDIEQMIDDMISNSTIKRALSKFDEDSETVSHAPKKKAS